jgi:ribosome biogenesis GTPase / thiamine phosphate phosphatase
MSLVPISPELVQLGLTPFFVQQLHALGEQDHSNRALARIVCERRGEHEVLSQHGVWRVALSGRLEHELADDLRPAVGDWVVAERGDPVGRIHHLLERQNALCRRGVLQGSRAQTLAANVDLCCVVSALTAQDVDRHAQRRALNPKRIERYLLTARASRIPALVLINKADLLPPELAEQRLAELAQRLPGARILLVSAHTGQGLSELKSELASGSSAALLGSSGVGKSSIVNALLGSEALRIGAERSDDTRGRHTTTERHLLQLPTGGMLVDTPGMRELSLWADADSDVTDTGFDDIDELARGCHFRDCRHQAEPGCAVLAAIDAGQLSRERLEHAHKLERELLHQQARVDVRLRQAQVNRQKVRGRAARAGMRLKGRG